ncbi:MAG: hypothetical protein PHR77_14845, partial [Kiritimatiellae bacterium]|nr:hypothetical protein [Kiritimatiellia bacterium]
VPVWLTNAVAIAGAGYNSLALRGDGTVAAWGQNNYGQTNVPVGLSNVVAVAGGHEYSLALRSDGTVVAWGRNNDGQTNVPVGLSNVMGIAGGYNCSSALGPGFQFTRAVGAHGSVTGDGNGWYLLGRSVTVTAEPDVYYHFLVWIGDVPTGLTNANPLALTMDQPRSVAANFAENLAMNETPHWWLAQYGLATNDVGALYEDGDSKPAWAEWIADTDPTNPVSCFKIVDISNLPDATVYFPSSTGRQYALEWRASLTGETWAVVGGQSNFFGNGGLASLVDSNAVPPRFYRVNVSAP